jgi:hypothetical protein
MAAESREDTSGAFPVRGLAGAQRAVTPPRFDQGEIVIPRLIAAKLNVAVGSDPRPINKAVEGADSLFSGFAGNLPYTVAPSSGVGQAMANAATALDRYNSDLLTPMCAQ